jgi:hypothetical protein
MGRKLMALVAMIAVAAMGSIGSTDTVINGIVQPFFISELMPFIRPLAPPPPPLPGIFLVIDEDSIDNGSPPNFFSDIDVNDQMAGLGLRAQLPYFAANVSETIELPTGQVGDEGWFAVNTIPNSWADTGPTDDGLQNFLGVNNTVGPGLGTGRDPEAYLDKISDVKPLRHEELEMLVGNTVCAVVYDGDISINYEPTSGSLKGATLGIVGFQVVSVQAVTNSSSSALPQVTITILDANEACVGPLALFTEVPQLPASEGPTIDEEVPRNTTNVEVPRNTTNLEEVPRNTTNVEVPQNRTQETGPANSNSSDASQEEPSDSGQDTGEDESGANNEDGDESAGGSEDTGEERQTNDNDGNDNSSGDQGGSENESGEEEDNPRDSENTGEEEQGNDNDSSDESSGRSNPSEDPPRGQ